MYLTFEDFELSLDKIIKKGQIHCNKDVDMTIHFLNYQWAYEILEHYSIEVIFLTYV